MISINDSHLQDQEELEALKEQEAKKIQEHQNILAKNIFSIMDEEENKDIILIVGNSQDEKKSIFAHKYILSARR